MKEFIVTLVKERGMTQDRSVYGRASVREVLRREFRVDSMSREEATKAVLDMLRADRFGEGRSWLASSVEVEEVCE